MNYLIDTCVLSECVKKNPNPNIVQWINQQKPEQLFLSSITLAELKKGIYKIQNTQPERYQVLTNWLNTIEHKFALRILPITDDILTRWAKISAIAECQGRKLAVMDGLIAATALEKNLMVITRNTSDFDITGVPLLNPWEL